MIYKIAVDARPLSSSISGISRMISKILENLDLPYEFYLFSHLPIHQDFENLLKKRNIHWKTLKITPLSKKGGSWFLWDLPYFLNTYLKPNIFWGTQQTIPLFLNNSIKKLITVLDFVSYYYPHSMRKIAFYQQKFLLKRSFQKADLNICISKSTAKDLKKIFPFAKNVQVIPVGFDKPKKIVKSKNPLLKTPFILAVSTIEPRKNYSTLIDAYYEYYLQEKKDPYSLVIIGKKGWETKEFYSHLEEMQSRTKKIFILENISDDELYNFYQNCAFLCMPSLYEGFGIPIIEALSFSKNVIVSDIPVFREVAGKYAKFIPPLEVKKWSEAIYQYVELHRKGKLRPVSFNSKLVSWKTISESYKAAFNSLISS
ncbi:MAG: glycosyltransferase family 4 protein [Leptonema sp. (in: bacteria)]